MLANPAVTTALCLLVIIGIWTKTGSRGFARQQSGKPFMPLHGIWSGTRQAEFNAAKKIQMLKKTPGFAMGAVERFFLGRMRAVTGRFVQTSLWGSLYVLTGGSAPARPVNVLLGALGLAAITVILGFYHPERFPPEVSGASLALYLVFAITAEYRINPYAALMLNISRKNRFRSLMLSAAARVAVTTIVSVFVVAASRAAGLFLAEITFLGNTLTYVPVNPRAFFLFLPMLPFFFVCQILFPRHTVVTLMAVSIVSIIIFVTHAGQLLGMSPTGFALIQVVGWLPFVLLVRHYCYFWDLKLNGQ
jgi:hypothetical protein